MPEKPSGFTLVLDGDPDEIKRILDAVGREYERITLEAWRAQDELFLAAPIPPHVRSSLRGRVELRFDARALLERDQETTPPPWWVGRRRVSP